MAVDARARFANRLAELARLVRRAETPADRERVAAELDRLAGRACS